MQKKYNSNKIPLTPKALQRIRIAIIASQYHTKIAQGLEGSCLKTLVKNGIQQKNILICHVPGSLEIPVAAKLIAEKKKPDVIIALGCVIRGETYHFDVVVNNCTFGCQHVALEYGIPIINEVLACYTLKQAKERSGNNKYNKGIEAAITALRMIEVVKNFL